MAYLVYPYSNDFIPLVRDTSQIEYQIKSVVFPKGWKKNIHVPKGIQGSTDFFEALHNVEGVIFTDINCWPYLYKDVVNKIKFVLDLGLKVVCCAELKEVELLKFAVYSNFRYYKNATLFHGLKRTPYQIQDCPVLCVGNLFRGMKNSEVVFEISEQLKRKGYTVLTVMPNDRNYFLAGYEIFTDEFYDSISLEEYVITYNNYINSLQAARSADIIVIGMPDGMIKYSDVCPGGYGIKNYILSQAISIDYFILNTPLDVIEVEGLNLLSDAFKFKYGFEIDSIIFSRLYVDAAASNEEEKLVFQFADEKAVFNSIDLYRGEDDKHGYYDINDLSSYETIVNKCIEKLSGSIDLF